MDSVSLKQIPKFSGERKHFPVWFTKATAVCALNGVSPKLKAGFKDMLPANDAILLDKTKPDEFPFIVNKNANLVAINLSTVMLCDTDAMIMLIDSTKTKDWPDGLAWKRTEKLCTKFKPGDMASTEQLEKLMKLTLKKNQDPEYLKSKIASLKTSHGCQIEEKLRIAAIVKAGGKQYSADIHSKTKAFKRAGGNVTSADLIQAMMESFRIFGNADSDTNDSDGDEVKLAATEFKFKFSCNLCGKSRHKAKECPQPQRNKIKCEHCGRLGHTKATCLKLEANKSIRPAWWTDMAAATADEGGEHLL